MKKIFSLWGRVAVVLFVATALIFSSTQTAQAVSINHEGLIGSDQTIDDDLIISAETVTIDGTINGLVLASGNKVVVNGTINGDLFAFGAEVEMGPQAVITGNVFSGARSVTTAGKVEGSLFAGAMTLHLTDKASVARNLFFGGFDFQTSTDTQIGRDLLFGGYQAILNGTVAHDVKIGGAAIELKGKIGGDASLALSQSSSGKEPDFSYFKMSGFEMPEAIPAGLRIDPAAEITGKLTYTSPVEYTSNIQSKPAGGVVYQTPVPAETGNNESQFSPLQSTLHSENLLVNTLWGVLRRFISLLIVGLLLVWLVPNLLQKTIATARSKPLPAAGVGALSILITYIGAFIVTLVLLALGLLLAFLTLGGLNQIIFGLGFTTLTAVVAAFTTLVAFVSVVIVSYLVGDQLMKQLLPTVKNRMVWAMVIGVFLYAVITAIPVLGWILGLAAILVGLGAIWYGLVVKTTPPSIPETVQPA